MAKIRKEINLLCSSYSVSGSAGSPSEDISPRISQLDTTKYSGTVSYYFEIVIESNITATSIYLSRKGTTTFDATISTGPTSGYVILRSSSFTPPSGQTEYTLSSEITSGSGIFTVKSARIVIIQNGTINSIETQIEVGDQSSGSQTTLTPFTYIKYWNYDSSKWDGTLSFFVEACYNTATTMNSATIVLQQDDGSFGSWADLATIVSAQSNTANTRTRVSFTPTSGRNYRIAFSSSSTKSVVNISNCKIIVQQSGSITKTESQYLLVNSQVPFSTSLQSAFTTFDPNEWESVSNAYFHECSGVSGGTSDIKLQSLSPTTDITNSSITDVTERKRSSEMTMPSVSKTIDCIATEYSTNLVGSKIIVQSVILIRIPRPTSVGHPFIV